MESFFKNIYTFFNSKKIVFVGFVVAFFTVFGYLTFQLKFEENISKMLPAKEAIMKVNQTIESSGFMDRLFVHAYTELENPDLLTEFADNFAEKINNSPDSGLIRSFEYRLSNEDEQQVFDFVQSNLPLLLNEDDYAAIEKKISRENIDASIKSGYNMLITPAGAWSAPIFLKDPLNFAELGFNKLSDLRLDDNINLHNGYYMTKDKKHLLMWVIPSNEPNETTENAKLLLALDNILKDINTAEVQGEYFGTTAVAVGNAERIKGDIHTTVAIAFTVLLLFLSFYFRKPLTIIYLFTPVLFGGLFALAFLYLFKGSISAISLGIGSLIVGITIDFSLHFLNHFKSEDNTIEVLNATSRPILTSCLTTASAFLCLTLVESEALTDLGIFAGISVIGAALATLVILPQLIKPTPKDASKPNNSPDFLMRISSIPLERNFMLLGVVILITLVCSFFFKSVKFDGNMEKMNYMSADLEAAEKRLSSINGQSEKTIYLVAQSLDLEAALSENLNVGNAIDALKKEFPKISYANSSALLFSEAEQKKRLNLWSQFWTDERIQQLNLDLEESSSHFRFKKDAFAQLFNRIEQDYSTCSLTDIKEIKALNINAFCGEKDGLNVFFNPVKLNGESVESVKKYLVSKDVFVFDKASFTNSIVTSLQNDFSSLIWASLVIVFLILLLFFRHSLLAILTLLPVIVSWVWVTGIMSLFNIPFNIFNIIVSSLVFGLGIDYAIFITSGLIEELRTGVNKISVYKSSILLSALTTVCGVGALILAKHPALYSMAFISILGIGSAVLVSFTLQAFLIRVLIVNRSKKGVEPYTTFTLLATIWTFTFFIVGCCIALLMAYIILPLVPIKKEKKVRIVTWISSKWLRALTSHQKHIPQHLKFPTKETLSKPKIIIANHESFLDILVLLGMSTKNILLTNDWVYNSPFFGKVVQYVGFYPVSRGFEEALPHLKKKIDEGYNICIFPEGTRSKDPIMSRFHKGAFYIAQNLKLDIVPIILHGYGHLLSKGDDFLVKRGRVNFETLDTIEYNDTSWGTTDRERYKAISKHYKNEFYNFRREHEDVSFYKFQLENNYLYKGQELEKNSRFILKKNETTFNAINDVIPQKANVLVLGDQMGLLALFLTYISTKRKINGLFKSKKDLKLASNCFSYLKNDRSHFQLLQDAFNYENIDFIVIAGDMSNTQGQDLNYIINQSFDRMNTTCCLILAQCNSIPELTLAKKEEKNGLVFIRKEN
ncbi:MAG: MMPL family transporter [Salibacteraceae bacterium]